MRNHFQWGVFMAATLAVVLSGCSKKTDANAELEKAASALATAAPAPTPAAATSQPTQPLQPATAAEAAPAPAQQISQALLAYKAGNLEDAVTRLHKLRAMPALSPQQRITLNDAMAAVMTEVYSLADKGDGRAIQAVKQYEQMQTQRR